MNLKHWLSEGPLATLVGRYKRFNESIISAKIIAIVLMTVFIPSVLITVLGFVAVYIAQKNYREVTEYSSEIVLDQLYQKVNKEWGYRLKRYDTSIRSEEYLHRYLSSVPELDDHVEDVALYEDGDFQPLEIERPFWTLRVPLDDPSIEEAWKLEFRGSDSAAALPLYVRLAAGQSSPDIEVEALAGVARCRLALGRWRESIEIWRKLLQRYGDTDDGSGLPRALPILWRIVEIYQKNGEPGEASQDAYRLSRKLESLKPWLSDDVVEEYTRNLKPFWKNMQEVTSGEEPELKPWQSTFVSVPAIRQRLLDHAVEHSNSSEPGYLVLDGKTIDPRIFAYFPRPDSDRVVYVELRPEAYVSDARLFTKQLQIPDELLVLSVDSESPSFSDASGDASGDRGSGPLLSVDFPPPFSHVAMHHYPAPDQIPRDLQRLAALQTAELTWAIIVLVLTIFLGLKLSLRYFIQEMQVARMKTDFISFITHELKTPLTAIRMFTEMLMSGRTTTRDEEKECVELIDKEATRLSRLIGQILEYSQIERHDQVFNFTSCDMAEVIREAVKIFREESGDRELKIEINQAQEVSKIRMDRQAMVELFLNLLSNAYKYSGVRPGGTRVAGRPPHRIVINLRESIDDIFVDVVDFGMGIPKREQRKIFDKFYRAQDYLTREIEGTGLGLTFAEYIAKVHNGDIKVSSAVNQGSTFTLELRKTQIIAE